MNRLAAVLPLTLVLMACSGGPPPEPPAPPPLDPVGIYDCTVTAEGMEIGVTLTITGEAGGGYSGSINSDMGYAAVSDITVDGNRVSFVADNPEMVVFFNVQIEGDTLTGELDAGGFPGYITGRKR